MKKSRFLNRFFVVLTTACVMFSFSSCSSDDDDDDTTGVKGSYTGTVVIGSSTSSKSITAKVSDSDITLNSFPVSDLISQYMGEAGASIIAALSPINYAIPYTATATSTGYSLTLKPDTLSIAVPTSLTTSMTVKVVVAGQSAVYTESTKNLAFNITANTVIVAGVVMPTFTPTVFKVSLTK